VTVASKTPKITTQAASLSAKNLEIQANLILLLPGAAADLHALPFGQELKRRMDRANYKLNSATPFVTDLPNKTGTRVALAGLNPTQSAFELLTLTRLLIAAVKTPRLDRLLIASHGLKPSEAKRACEAVVAATLAAHFDLPSYKSKPDKPSPLREIFIYGYHTKGGYARTQAEAQGNNLARYLTALPSNDLTPGMYRTRVERLARQHGWKTEFLDMKKLRRLGAGAFVAVAQGSPLEDAGILCLRYRPRKKSNKRPLALVGKGICFDTGGTNLKPAKYMHGMHEDMEGSAVALGTLLALTELKVGYPVDCWLALAQNHIGPKAYKQNDVVKAANGTSIEIMHTDAEGRMVLADTLYLAAKQKPKLIIDYATLTGACVGALSTRVSGVFTNNAEMIPWLIGAGDASGERVWPFPLYPDFEEALKSDIADIKQCTLDSDADHILGALFLKKFLVHNPDWVHMDLSAGNRKGGLGHIPTDTTGFGIRFTLNLLFDQGVFT
jgi:leucyl aminopeptidase